MKTLDALCPKSTFVCVSVLCKWSWCGVIPTPTNAAELKMFCPLWVKWLLRISRDPLLSSLMTRIRITRRCPEREILSSRGSAISHFTSYKKPRTLRKTFNVTVKTARRATEQEPEWTWGKYQHRAVSRARCFTQWHHPCAWSEAIYSINHIQVGNAIWALLFVVIWIHEPWGVSVQSPDNKWLEEEVESFTSCTRLLRRQTRRDAASQGERGKTIERASSH